MASGDDDWPAVVIKSKNARKSWERLTRILGRKGVYPRVSSMFFKALVQAVFIFWLETWFLTHHMERGLVSFKQGVSRRITGRQPRRRG